MRHLQRDQDKGRREEEEERDGALQYAGGMLVYEDDKGWQWRT